MKTPIYDFAREYALKNAVRTHMPGHKGVDTKLGIEHLDITEFDGADNLWHPTGIIAESMENASKLFGAHTFYSTEGSSLSIRAMLFMIKKWAALNNVEPVILAGRNAHKTFINTVSILDMEVQWLMPSENDSYQSCTITAEDVEEYFECPRADLVSKPAAVYITSPDYLGNTLDIQEIANVCHKNGAFLLVDNAHGAYLKFLEKSLHPMDLGADMCCDSAHKTLPALTGAGYLHINKNTDPFFKDNAREAMELWASTSPSYLILESLDLTNAYLEGFSEKLCALTKTVNDFKMHLKGLGFTLKGSEPVKVTIDAREYGYTGDELADILMAHEIYTEYHDEDYLVMMFTTFTTQADFARLSKAFAGIKKREALGKKVVNLCNPKAELSPHEALYKPTKTVPREKAAGKVLGETAVSCPPCVPVYMMGEVIEDTVLLPEKVKVIEK